MARKLSSPPEDRGPEAVSCCWGVCICVFEGIKGYLKAKQNPSMAAAEEEDGGPEGPNRERGGAGATFECNICLETAREAVVSVCGHLYW